MAIERGTAQPGTRTMTDDESAVRAILQQINDAWREKRFTGLSDCFAENAVIVGPDYRTFASGRNACADSYREFATNAAVLEYAENNHELHLWPVTAVFTFAWRMTYQREHGPKAEAGTDQLVLSKVDGAWKVVFRYIYFTAGT